jgi:uncharacterized protein with NRDE domain
MTIYFVFSLQATRLRSSFKELLLKYGDNEIVSKDTAEKLMTDRTKADKNMLPNTGCDIDYELGISAIFVEMKAKKVRSNYSKISTKIKRNCPQQIWFKHVK